MEVSVYDKTLRHLLRLYAAARSRDGWITDKQRDVVCALIESQLPHQSVAVLVTWLTTAIKALLAFPLTRLAFHHDQK